MPSVIVAGAGLAGLACAAALGDAGFEVDVHELRPYPGGRATSYPIPRVEGGSEVLDNCQHILLRCCVNLLDFYRRLGVSGQVDFHREFYWLEPGGRMSVFRAGRFPAPAHFTESFLGLHFLSLTEKLQISRGMLAILREKKSSERLDEISMQTWLIEHGQSDRVIDLFWRQVLVSAVNEELASMSAFHGLQVFRLGFLASRDAYEMGVPSVTLGELYGPKYWSRWPNVRLHYRSGVAAVNGSCKLSDGRVVKADYYVLAMPFEHVGSVLDGYVPPPLEHSPITGVHLWFDRSVTTLPHATLLERNIQWLFNKGDGRHLQLVMSASRPMTPMARRDVIDLCVTELREFLPEARDAVLLRAHVVKEVRATMSVKPGVAELRRSTRSALPHVFIAGDWTWTGWPSTMEGAVRSGYAAADDVCHSAGIGARFLLPDIA